MCEELRNESSRLLPAMGVIQISAANLVVILLMPAVFVLALFAPSPGRRRR